MPVSNELVKLNQYTTWLEQLPQYPVTVWAETIDDALQLGLNELQTRVNLHRCQRDDFGYWRMVTPLPDSIDYICRKRLT